MQNRDGQKRRGFDRHVKERGRGLHPAGLHSATIWVAVESIDRVPRQVLFSEIQSRPESRDATASATLIPSTAAERMPPA